MRSSFLFVFFGCYAYAAIRYHLGADVPLHNWLFILNKAFAWTAFTWIGLSVLPQAILTRIHTNRRILGVSGFMLGIVHVGITLCHLGPAYYAKLYAGSTLNFFGWTAILLGILSIVIYSFPLVGALRKLPNESRIFRLGKIGFMISTLHPAVIGVTGWFTPGKWPLYMPPITLLACLSGIAILLFRLVLKRPV